MKYGCTRPLVGDAAMDRSEVDLGGGPTILDSRQFADETNGRGRDGRGEGRGDSEDEPGGDRRRPELREGERNALRHADDHLREERCWSPRLRRAEANMEFGTAIAGIIRRVKTIAL